MATSTYQRVEVYCFSGTGNALRATQWMSERASAGGAAFRLTRIERGTRVALPDGPERTLLGFDADGVWQTDDTQLPTRLVAATGEFGFEPPRAIGASALDNVFTGWGGACAGTGTCVVTMTAAWEVSAMFTHAAAPCTSPITFAGSTGAASWL